MITTKEEFKKALVSEFTDWLDLNNILCQDPRVLNEYLEITRRSLTEVKPQDMLLALSGENPEVANRLGSRAKKAIRLQQLCEAHYNLYINNTRTCVQETTNADGTRLSRESR